MKRVVVAFMGAALAGLAPAGLAAQDAPAPGGQRQPGKPANLCQELVAYLDKPAQAPKPASDPKLTTAVQAPKPGETTKAAGEGAPTQSGLSAPTGHQVGQGAPGPQGQAQSTGTPSPAPAPAAQTGSGQAQVTLDDARALASANDLSGCREATQKLRRAGAPLPADLLALGALDLKFFTN